MDKVYNHFSVESKLKVYWEQQKLAITKDLGEPYCIIVPPPNVTGTLHMGHGFQLTIMDVLIRYHNMNGYNTLLQVGTDHAGIATQMVVERELERNNQPDKHSLGREKFIDKVFDFKNNSREKITQQMKMLGASIDWQRERFTLDAEYVEKVKQVFVSLYDEGLIYRGQKLVNWDPKLKTAISDLEVINKEQSGNLWHIKYPIYNENNKYLVIATTRPETLLGDQAVAVNPDDERYKDLIGKYVILPIVDKKIPIIADNYVDPDFGSGCVKITPAHDFNDAEVGKRHSLDFVNILNDDATLNQNVPKIYQGLDRFLARKQIISELESLSLLEKIEPHVHMVPVGDRSGVILEPMLTKQWFLKCDQIAKVALKEVADGNIKFVPHNWVNTYNHWLNNIQDWCISRQLWWGHRIPAWYDDFSNIYVGNSLEEVREKYNLNPNEKLTQEQDVLDTWFSSALWPFVTLGWGQDDSFMDKFYPTQVLVTGFDIIFFWVARMIMLGKKCTGKIPFKEVYITGLIKDENGQKMSKSKGNVLDPIDIIEGISLDDLVKKRTSTLMQPKMAEKIKKQTKKSFPDGIKPHGTDALRFTFCALASNGRDINFDTNRLLGYRNFCNKIWNAARFIIEQEYSEPESNNYTEVDLWILNRLQECINNCHKYIKSYRFDMLAKVIHEFVWLDFCDKYLEWSKVDKKINQDSQSLNVSGYVLENILKMIHPIMPFISEEIWQNLNKNSCLAQEKYPECSDIISYEVSEVDLFFSMLSNVRNLRSELNISFKQDLLLIIAQATKKEQDLLFKYERHFQEILRCKILNEPIKDSVSVSLVVNSIHFLVPIESSVDPSSEIVRIEQMIKKITKQKELAMSRLNNEMYCKNAPKAQVEEYRNMLENADISIKKYTDYMLIMKKMLESVK